MRFGRRLGSLTAGTAAAALTAGLALAAAPPGAAATRWTACRDGGGSQDVYSRAATASGVPRSVLLAVSYLESRWDDHAGRPSTAGGYGPMHLVDPTLDPGPAAGSHKAARGEATGGRVGVVRGPLQRAAALTGLSQQALRRDPAANVCGGAALLASYQKAAAPGHVRATAPRAWTAAIARYSGAADEGTATRFVAQVFSVLRSGEQRTTDQGRSVRLAARPTARPDLSAVRRLGLEPSSDDARVTCPARLGCEWVPAPYTWYDTSSPGRYGNHDLADRPAKRLKIRFIVIHDTEASWDTTLKLVQDPTYVSWNYSIRSSDGQVAEHVDPENVAWHAGNWYVNMHSIGIEHEGYGDDGSWFTESMYESSAALVRYLAAKYGVPLDRAHIIGHDQVPGTVPSTIPGMHWDPGPYWDWEHYFDLLGSPISGDPGSSGKVVTVRPGFVGNSNPVTGCTVDPCATANTNFVYLHTSPSEDAPLVPDVGMHPGATSASTGVSDIGARATAGQKLYVAQRHGDWLGVWWLGEIAWLHSPADHPTVVPARGRIVVPRSGSAVPVYGRAYPEQSAYPAQIPYQSVTPMPYTLKPGQATVLADFTPPTDYYYAKTFDCGYLAKDCTDVTGKDRYYEVWFGHRVEFVRAADVRVLNQRARVG